MIRWITDQLGTAAWDKAQGVTGCALLDVRDMVDKSGNLPDEIRCKVEEGAAFLRRGERLIVCCDYGMSRSNAIAAGILAASTPMPFDAAVRQVCRATGETAIQLEVLATVRAAIETVAVKVSDVRRVRSILVTGASGSVGSAFIAHLPAEWRVVAPSRTQLDLRMGSVDLDLILRDVCADVVVHLANPRVVTTNQSLGESLVILKNVLDACRASKTRLLYLSGGVVFAGYRTTGILADEQTPMQPAGTYSQAKYFAELLIDQYRRQFGLPCTVVRASPVYGEYCSKPKFLANFIEKALAGRPIITHCYQNGPPRLDLLHVSDLANALQAIVAADLSDTFHVGPGTNASTAEIAEMVVDLTDSPSRIEQRSIGEFAPNVMLDSTRFRNHFEWQPRIRLRDGLSQIVDQHKAAIQVEQRGAS